MSNELQTTSTGAIVPLADLEKMAKYIAESGLFGVKKPAEAMALMLIAQAEGLHPATVAQDYDIIQGRAARKTHSVLSRFMQAGGKVRWSEMTDTCAKATFSHPSGGEVTIDWTIERARKTKVWNAKKDAFEALADRQMYQNYPRAMLRSRCVAEGVRAVFPPAIGGMLLVEEAEDAPAEMDASATIVEQPRAKPAQQEPAKGSAAAPLFEDATVISESPRPAAPKTQESQVAPEKPKAQAPTLADCVAVLDKAGDRPDQVMGTILEWRKVLPQEDVVKLDELIEALGVSAPAAPAVKPLTTPQQRILKARLATNGKTVEQLEAHMGAKLDAIPFDQWDKAQAFAIGNA
jgi:hypothetical protein